MGLITSAFATPRAVAVAVVAATSCDSANLQPRKAQYQHPPHPNPSSRHRLPIKMATLAKLTSISTQTLSLLLERQRLSSLSSGSNSLHLPQITRNLNQLKNGILESEEKEGQSEAVRLLKSQFERMRGMLGEDADIAGVPRYSHHIHHHC